MKNTPPSKISAKISAWGNGFGIRIPKNFVDALDMKKTDILEITNGGNNTFILKKVGASLSKEHFRISLSKMKTEFIDEEYNVPVGREIIEEYTASK